MIVGYKTQPKPTGRVIVKPSKKKVRFIKKYKKPSPSKTFSTVNLGQGFPKKLIFTHKFNSLTTATSSTGTPIQVQWTANGMYDPYITGVGTQPYYFDQLTALYNHYTVIGSKVTFIVSGTGTVVPCQCGVYINDDTTNTVTTLNGLAELSQGRFKNLNNQSGPIKFSLKWSAKKMFGGNVLANDLLQGNASTNPTEQSYYTFYLGAMDQASTQTFVIQAFIEYIAVWKELKDVATS